LENAECMGVFFFSLENAECMYNFWDFTAY
jgi:hypothetical protein